MKKNIRSSLIAGLFLSLTTTHSLADEYFGDFCWQVFSNTGEPLWAYEFGVYRKQGGHMELYGAIDYEANGVSASHGSAIIVGEKVKLTIVSSDYEEGYGVWGETFNARLNASTLSGEWDALSLETMDGQNVQAVYQFGHMDLIDCH